MFLSGHHIHRFLVNETNSLETVPPRLFMYSTAVVLSILSRIDTLDLVFVNDLTAGVTAVAPDN